LELALEQFEKFNDFLGKHPDAMDRFIKAKRNLLEIPRLIDTIDPSLVEGIFMLDLGDEDVTMPDAMDRMNKKDDGDDLDIKFDNVYPDAMDRLKAVSAKILEESK